jgi:DNA-binding CsgD family transcriptional regulator
MSGTNNHPISPEQLLPHLQGLELALDSLGQALIVLRSKRDVIYASPSAQKILTENDGLTLLEGVLMATVENSNAVLSDTLDGLLSGNGDSAGSPKQELLIRRPSGKRPFKLRINPFQQTHERDGEYGALIMIHDTHANYIAWYERLQARFNLTPRECECTILLTEGYSMDEVAERLEVSKQTLRQHLKHTFQKTGTCKQHELVGLVLQMHRKR